MPLNILQQFKQALQGKPDSSNIRSQSLTVPADVETAAVNQIKLTTVIEFRVVRIYQRMLILTAPFLPTLTATEDEIKAFHRWTRETPRDSIAVDLGNAAMVKRQQQISQYQNSIFARAEQVQIDGITLARLSAIWKSIRASNRIGSDAAKQAMQDRIRQNPQDGQAYYELALHSMVSSKLSVESLLDFQRKSSVYMMALMGGQDFAVDLLSKAIALGLKDPVHSAVAQFAYAFLLGTVSASFNVHPSPQNIAKANSIYREITSLLDYYLRQSPRDLFALQLLSACYKMQDQLELQQRTELQIEKVLQLSELQVVADVSQTSTAREESSTQQKGLQFEDVCLRLVRKMGFDAQTTTITGDGGIDIIAFSAQPVIAGKYVVQCKAWKQSIGEPLIRDLYGVVHSERANKGIFITTSTYTKSALAFAKDKPLELIDGQQFYQLLRQYSPEVLPK